MRRTPWVLSAGAVFVGVVLTGGVMVMSSETGTSTAAQHRPANTATVERGDLSAMVSVSGILTHRARSDGSPYPVINNAVGTYTKLPAVGDEIGCGDVLYRVDDRPVLLLCGTVPAYRTLESGVVGDDVRQLNKNLHELGHDAVAGVAPNEDAFTSETQRALRALQRATGLAPTGQLRICDAVFLPDPVRIAQVTGELGGPAQPAASVMYATSGVIEVQVNLEASQQGSVSEGDHAQITLPNNESITGTVNRLGAVAGAPVGQNGAGAENQPGAATIPVSIGLDDPAKARGFEEAPVWADILTKGVDDVLSVPVAALVGKSGGGFAVEVVRDGGRRELVAVQLGLFDTTAGRVQIDGDIGDGAQVVVPSS